MTQYALLNPIIGESHKLSEEVLTQNMRSGWILLRGRKHICIITHRDIVTFCRWSAGVLEPRMTLPPTPLSLQALQLADQCLEDPESLPVSGRAFLTGLTSDISNAWSTESIMTSPGRAIANASCSSEIAADLAWSLDYHAIIKYRAQA
jgi:hypothetical protein